MGIGMLFQSPPEIEGLPVSRLVSTAFGENSEECLLAPRSSPLDIQKVSEVTTMSELVSRDLNVGFSGGERKRCEAFQLLLQKPLLSMLDEPESGVDLESVRVLGKALSSLQNQPINGRRSATISRIDGGVRCSHHAHGKHLGVHAWHDRPCGDGGSDRVHGQRIRVLPDYPERRVRVGPSAVVSLSHFRNLKCDLECAHCSEKPTHDGANSMQL